MKIKFKISGPPTEISPEQSSQSHHTRERYINWQSYVRKSCYDQNKVAGVAVQFSDADSKGVKTNRVLKAVDHSVKPFALHGTKALIDVTIIWPDSYTKHNAAAVFDSIVDALFVEKDVVVSGMFAVEPKGDPGVTVDITF